MVCSVNKKLFVGHKVSSSFNFLFFTTFHLWNPKKLVHCFKIKHSAKCKLSRNQRADNLLQ